MSTTQHPCPASPLDETITDMNTSVDNSRTGKRGLDQSRRQLASQEKQTYSHIPSLLAHTDTSLTHSLTEYVDATCMNFVHLFTYSIPA